MKTRFKKIIPFVTTFCAVYLVLLVAMFFFQRSLQYHPDTNALGQPNHENWENVQFETTDGLTLQNWYVAPQNKDKAVMVFFHGNAGNASHRLYKMDFLRKQGFGVLLLEYRGFGGNAGEATEEGLYKDGRAGLMWLQNDQNIPLNKIVLYGESLGTGIATQMATEYKTAGLILEAPFYSFVSVAGVHYPMIPVGYLLKDRYRSDKKIADINMPLLIIHGTGDLVIPISQSVALYKEASEPKKFIKVQDARHNNLYHAPLVKAGVLAFILEK